jgi:hypothetical protein
MSHFLALLTSPVSTKEFGIDIVGEDNKTIIRHKVAAHVLCVLSEQDAHVAAHAEQDQQRQQQLQHQQASNIALNTLTNNLFPLRPHLESAEPSPLKRIDLGVSHSLRRGQLVGDRLCNRRVLEGWTGWEVGTSGSQGRTG